ncbi:MAG: ABC-F family ATP-binding cassette domain-containing protein [Clostridia bacterium]|nr:ABC-F family ATP-binding cassette domain-containing protein [Clostridia bacterium]
MLTQVDMEINTQSRIGVVGRNGCGKTTLLRLLSGELQPARKTGADDTVFAVSGTPTIGVLSQMTFVDDHVTLVDEVRSAYREILTMKDKLDRLQQQMEESRSDEVIAEYSTLLDQFTNLGGFYFEREYEAAIKNFGFTEEEKHKPLSDFSGGQRTKIAFLKLLLSKPDLLLLDEPTNHLDIDAVRWLEDYLRAYKKAFVIVSHDRMFLDRTVEMIYEIEHGKTNRYVGNYTQFTAAKKLRAEQQEKLYAAQQKEIAHLQSVADRFRYKATKAAMAQSKLKQIDRMEKIDAPESADLRTFHTDFAPDTVSVKDVLDVKALKIGYDVPLSTVEMNAERGDRIGIVGGNGLGKSTFLKTLVNAIPALGGNYYFGGGVKIGYFDQQMARYVNHNTVFDDFLSAFPRLSDFEVRSALAAFLFTGDEVFKTLDVLSGGERVRLALCKLFQNRPNVLILDEPTNHMDILGKETLEELLLGYGGTLIFVSHDRYFIQKLATKLLVFEDGETHFYPYGYEQYEADRRKPAAPTVQKAEAPKPKKTYTTPLKERSKRERALQKAEEKVALLEEKQSGIETELRLDENICDYLKLSELQQELAAVEEELSVAMSEWERAEEALAELNAE